MELNNKVAVVTGASDGIGRQVALRLAKEGCQLALLGRGAQKLEAVKTEALSSGASKVVIYPGDLRAQTYLKETVKAVLADFPAVDILLNIAGIWQKKMPLEEIEESVVDEVLDTNLKALIHLTRLFLPRLKVRSEAAIINISSKSGIVAAEGQSVYAASKYGVRGFTEVLRLDLKNSKVRVGGVYQAGINTQMFAKTGETVPLEKFTEPEDLAEVIVFMLSRPKKIWLYDVWVEY